MRTIVASEWMTLDGIFDADSMDKWFEPYDSKARQAYIKKNVDEADAFLIGRTTYELFASYWPNQHNNEEGIADRLNSQPKYVVSSSLKKADWGPATIISEDVEAAVKKLKDQPGKTIMIFGSAMLVESLMKAGLVDEFRFLVHPIVMSKGKRFFRDGMGKYELKLLDSEAIGEGVTLQRFGRGTGKPSKAAVERAAEAASR